jgi:hypothetical protein
VIRTATRFALVFAFMLAVSPAVFAQDDDDAVLKPAEPDVTLVSLPTAMRLPQWGSEARFTHRFSLPFNNGETFSDYSGQLFGLDSSAVIGLEYRIGIVKNGQIGVQHSSDNRTWDFFGQYGLVRQSHRSPIDISALVSIDLIREPIPNTPSFDRKGAPGVAAIVSRTIGEHAALYVEPIYVHNVFNEFPTFSSETNAFLIGVGGRVRICPTMYLVAETAPRVSGFMANTTHTAFGIEKRVGGHVFQLNASNSFGTTLSQLAMGGGPANNWHLGFNISRKFF